MAYTQSDWTMKPITRQAWTDLSKKQRWDVRVALRGPDHGNELLKLFTTSCIRYGCTKVMRVGGLINFHSPALILPNAPAYRLSGGRDDPWGFNVSHFVGHIEEAAQILELPAVKIPLDIWMMAFSNYVSRLAGLEMIRKGLRKAVTSNAASVDETPLHKQILTKALLYHVTGLIEAYHDSTSEEEEEEDADE